LTFLKEVKVLQEGFVKWFIEKEGFGFIEGEDGDEILLLHTSLKVLNSVGLNQGDLVSFDLEESAQGPVAKNVIKV
jgi:CspA family cold shock protein